jgi:phage gp29-like protein
VAPILRPELKEFAPAPSSPWGDFDSGRRLADPIARSEGFAGHPTPYSLFEEMEDKDPHLFSALQTRKLGVLARARKVEAAGDGTEDRRIAAWIDAALRAIPGWNDALLHLLDALGKGMAVLEILWGFDADGRIVPLELKPRPAARFARNPAGQWRLLPAETLAPAAPARPLPPRKFVIARWGASDDRPYGKGLCERVYWLWWFKKHNLKFWLVYNEKFGSPTVLARHRPGLGEPERRRLLEVIEAIQNDAGVTLPDGIDIELLEAGRAGNAETYRALAQWCNDEISRAILGQTLTSGEGDRAGSLALGRVHEAVRRDYIRADAWMLMDAVNQQLIRWLVDFNFDPDTPAPRWTIDLSPELDLAGEVAVDRQLLQMGVPLPLRYFHDKYGRPAPAAADRPLQWDDSNLYQYHLQFGILTLNEVRSRLGLAPVPWGERPTSPAGGPIDSPTPAAPAGETTPEERGSGPGAEKGDGEPKRLKRTEK